LQIIFTIYTLEVVAKAIYLLMNRLCARYSVDYSRLRGRHKNDTAPAPPPELLVFMSVSLAPELSFFMAPASGRFHTLIFY